jgi:hypothetical protein
VASEPEALVAWFRGLGCEIVRVGLEAGPLSQWLYAAMRVCCNQEYACGLQQGLDDEPTPVITQAEPLVLEQPGDGALNGPAPPPSPEPGGRLRWWMNGSAC